MMYHSTDFNEDSSNSTITLNNEPSLLHSAIVKQRIYLLEALLENPKLDINRRNKNFETPLLTAVKIPNEDTSVKIVQKLLTAGADLNLSDHKGETPLHAAVKTSYQIVTLLLTEKCDVNAKNILGETPLHVAKTAKIARNLIENGAHVNDCDTSGNSPLHKQVGSVEICKVLLQHGGKVNATNVNCLTPLHEALLNHHQDTASFLLENGADDVNIESDGISALHLAYLHRCSNRIKDVLWSRSKPANLLFVVIYDSSKRNEILKEWSTIADKNLLKFLLELLDLMECSRILQWVTSARLVADFFLNKISLLKRKDTRYFLRRFAQYLGHSVLNFLLRTHDYSRVNSMQEIEELIKTLLHFGEVLDYSDLEVIFVQKGDCGLLHRLLKCVTTNKIRKPESLPLFLKFLCDVTVNPTLLINHKTCSNIDVMDFYNVHTLARYATLPHVLTTQFRQTYRDIIRFDMPELCTEEMELSIREIEKNSGVPSLLELGRNATRVMLNQKFNVKSTKDLYKVLEKLEVPRILVSIIMMEFPLYDVVVPDYSCYKKILYLL